MKRILFFVTILLSSLYISAQTVHTILYADTNDDKIGSAAKISLKTYQMTCSQIATALTWDTSDPVIRSGYDCNKENLLKDLENLKCTDKDLVIFIYCGHGNRSPQDQSDFPQMCMAKRPGQSYRDQDDYFALENVRNIIMRKQPRLCFVIGDCCNSVDPDLDPKKIVSSDPQGKDYVPEGNPNILDLFAKREGSVILTAAVKGEYGWSHRDRGMLLQREFSSEIQRIFQGQSSHNTWEGFLSTVKNNVAKSDIIDIYGKHWRQHPFYRTYLKPNVTIKKDSTITPKPVVSGIRGELLQIADDRNYTDEERIDKRNEVLKKYFSDACIIDVAGKDGKTITLSLTAEQYLRRISTEQGLTNLVIFEQTYDKNGKIMYMELHEIYREIKRKI